MARKFLPGEEGGAYLHGSNAPRRLVASSRLSTISLASSVAHILAVDFAIQITIVPRVSNTYSLGNNECFSLHVANCIERSFAKLHI